TRCTLRVTLFAYTTLFRSANENAGFVRRGDEILRCGDGGSDHVNVGDQTLTNHAQGIADAVLRINDEFVREDVQDFAVFRERNVACGVDGAARSEERRVGKEWGSAGS